MGNKNLLYFLRSKAVSKLYFHYQYSLKIQLRPGFQKDINCFKFLLGVFELKQLYLIRKADIPKIFIQKIMIDIDHNYTKLFIF